ncbi:transcription elongation factor [Psychromonas sp. RZ22]|uniref:GreA/GreB family elongation factor n=1 Tax=Psychromonas algarum TaxID=2555643 RepID=UPI0010678DE4|nr:GreA/GreB family elongation factor [Psychromonas sp. RZ22]TEW53966.1 transcription elongation factor [Psychromonas sp. RZ22]
MNKIQLHQQLMVHLQQLLDNAKAAAKRAHETATSEENIAENKYDTLALEAAYLAQGQSQRVTQCQADIDACINLPLGKSSIVELGAVIVLLDQHDQAKYLLICPVAGGMKLQWGEHVIQVVTPQSPIGAAVFKQPVNQEISMTIAGKSQHYEILQII